jgi:dUTP pyrophosphatase
MNIEIINKSKHPLPKFETDASAGMDLCANIDSEITLNPGERILVKTGLFIALPNNYEAQIRPRSGMAYKNGVTVLNSPGTIDADYRGEIGVILINLSQEPFLIKDADRIAQMVVAPYTKFNWVGVKKLVTTRRGAGGFGSTGKS